jgi:hypothetical protein
MYGIVAPAPVCVDPPAVDDPACQVLQAPVAPGQQLVLDIPGITVGNTGEIQLTYGQLTTLIEDAVRQLTARTTA